MNTSAPMHPPHQPARRRWLAADAALMLGAGLAAPVLRAAPAALHAVTLDIPFFGMTEGGKLAGVFVDVVSALARASGIAIDNTLMPKIRAQAMLREGTADLLVGFDGADLLDRARHVGVVGSFDVGIVARAGVRLQSLADLHGKTVGRLRGVEFSDIFAADTAIFKQEVNTLPQVLQMVARGRIDAAIGVREALYYSMKVAGLDRQRFSSFLSIERRDAWLHYSRKTYDPALAERLAQALERLRASGELAALSERYLASVREP